jgi:hypothetical protein
VNLTARQLAKNLLNGEAPPRPLLLPIVFALGAKVENVPLSAFLNNPTKIVSAARQMRSHLQADGVACYFDAFLEVEALGATLQRTSDDEPPAIQWKIAKAGELPADLHSPEDAARNGRVPVAAEVIRRMNAVPNRDFLVMASVSGPVKLAALLTQSEQRGKASLEDWSAETLEFASSVATQMATTFLEAGADMILIHEQVPAGLTAKTCEDWANLLAPAINVMRFYEALPILQLAGELASIENSEMILRYAWDCLLCFPDCVASSSCFAESCATSSIKPGVALPLDFFLPDHAGKEERIASLREAVANTKPAVITTAGDVPYATDMRYLKRVFAEIPRAQ